MKSRKLAYAITTGLVALAFLAGGVFDLLRTPEVLEGMSHLGYPVYFASIIGLWKVLGAVAIVAPGFPRLKEWAYAGIFFDLTGAAVSHAAVGDPAGNIIAPLAMVAIAAASWALRPDSRKLASPSAARSPLPRGNSALATA
jgi:hypothetical protein